LPAVEGNAKIPDGLGQKASRPTSLEGDRMLGIVATLKVKPGMEGPFEAVAKELVAKVNAHEPGCVLYALHRAEAPHTYVFLERYVDQAAVDAHRATDYFKALGRQMGEFMDGRPEVLRLREVE
jgi:quinol monooxygenase YgiN